MNIKKQELKHDLGIELLKHRIECYALASKYTEPIVHYSYNKPDYNELQRTRKLDQAGKGWTVDVRKLSR
jgi:hypothetical protein